jgi:hypothetical protein
MRARLDFDDAAGQRVDVGLLRERDTGAILAGIAAWSDQLELSDHRVGDFGTARDREVHVDRLLGTAEQRRETLQLTAQRVHHRAEPDAVIILRHHFGARDIGLREDAEHCEQGGERGIADPAPLVSEGDRVHSVIALIEATPTSPPNRLPVISRSRAQNSPRLASIGT